MHLALHRVGHGPARAWTPDRVRHVVLQDAEHIPMWDAPEAVVEVLLAGSAAR